MTISNILLGCLYVMTFQLLGALSHDDHPLILLISFDGFRHDYLKMVREKGGKTPNFDKLRDNGVEADHVKNAFITKTFPNHFSIVTGHVEESHGLIANNMYDPVFNETFNLGIYDSKWFNNGTPFGGAEPIWITNERDAQTSLFQRRSGVMFWPGSEVEIHGMRPTHWQHYSNQFPNKSRVDNIVKWFSDKEKPINLGLLYFSEPDHTGHQVGPYSDRIVKLIVALDEIVGYLINELTKAGLFHRMNIIITSDHGMTEVPRGNLIELNKYIDPSDYSIYGNSPVKNILPKPGET